MSQHKNPWQTALIEAITDPRELLNILELDESWLEDAHKASRLFPLRVPQSFVNRMEKKNPYDPLLRQVLPLGLELHDTKNYSKDPLAEKRYNPIPGVLHKYHGRVLLILTGVCAVHCRYCFRRHFPYTDNNPGKDGWKQALDYIAKNSTIEEVIFSGGDPLALSDHQLQDFTQQLSLIPHLKYLRIHSRIPVVLPERVNQDLIRWISQTRLKTTVVIHCNHPNEIDETVKEALQKLSQQKVMLLNQGVLLKGVNDKSETLIRLSYALFDAGVLPYYLYTLDKVQGAAHFDLEHDTAKQLHQEITFKLPGYLVPKLVKEEPGSLAKVTITH